MLRVQAAAMTWGARGARVNSISPGIIVTPLARHELESEIGDIYRAMVEASALKRMAPPDSTQDKMWGWFNDIMSKGILQSDRTNNRKSGSIVMYDSTHVEVARFNFTNGWPSKISTDQLSVDSNDPVKETITLTIESLARVK